MQFGLMTEPQLGMTYDELLDAALLAESMGLHVFARSDHYDFPGVDAPHATDAFATLAGLARDTERIGLAVMVSPITFRHPGVIAKMAATIDEMSGGRLILGLGTGWMQDEHDLLGLEFPPLGERFDRLEETLAYLWSAFGRSPEPFRGEYYGLGDREVLPRPTGDLTLVVGGSGPKRTPHLAGTYADEYNIGFLPAEELPPRLDLARGAARAAGRDPEQLLISVMGPAIVGEDERSFRDNLARIAAADPFGRDADAIEERMRERGVPIGAAEEAADAIGRLAGLGIDRYYVQHFGPFDHDLLRETFDVVSG